MGRAEHKRLRAVLVFALIGACAGEIGGGAGDDGSPRGPAGPVGSAGSSAAPGSPDAPGPGAVPPGTNPGGIPVTCDMGDEPGVTPLTKLTTAQYRNSVRDLLRAAGADALVSGIEADLASVPDDSIGDSFRGLDNRISREHVQAYFDVGVAVGDALEADQALLRALAGECATTAPLSAACAEDFVERFGQLVYRRPLSAAEVDELTELNDGQRGPAEAIRAMVVVLLSSPRFVNHLEIDGSELASGADMLQLSAYEVASRLSYLFWRTMPDDELFTAAEDGSLATEAGFDAQLARVFEDDRTRDTLWEFWNEWLRLGQFTGFETTRPGFEALTDGDPIAPTLYDDMVQEVRDLTERFTFERTSTLADLLETNESVTRSSELAALYEVAPFSGATPPSFAAGTRAGLLQRAALLVSSLETTNPFHRGAFVRRTLLCDSLSQPDPNSLPPGSLDPPPVTAEETTRARFEAKVAGNGTCAACHDQFSAIGYALESFDALGRHRTLERVFDEQTGELLATLPLDTSGVPRIELTDAAPVMGATELNQRVVASKKVEGCMAEKYFAFALRREPTARTLDACTVQDLAAALDDPDAGLADALARIARHSSFFLRKVGPQ